MFKKIRRKSLCTKSFTIDFYRQFIYKDFINRDFVFYHFYNFVSLTSIFDELKK